MSRAASSSPRASKDGVPGGDHLGNGRRGTGLPMQPLVGNLWVPVWAVRPGAYRALQELAAEMPLWLAIHSRSSDYSLPCYATRQQLGKTVGIGVRTVTRQLEALRDAALLFDLDRGVEKKTRRHRPPARWAACPFASDFWLPRIEAQVHTIAEHDGQSSYWVSRALKELEHFHAQSGALRTAISEDMPFVPRPPRNKQRKRKRRASLR